jgi:hypothetical protein
VGQDYPAYLFSLGIYCNDSRYKRFGGCITGHIGCQAAEIFRKMTGPAMKNDLHAMGQKD